MRIGKVTIKKVEGGWLEIIQDQRVGKEKIIVPTSGGNGWFKYTDFEGDISIIWGTPGEIEERKDFYAISQEDFEELKEFLDKHNEKEIANLILAFIISHRFGAEKK